MKEKGNVLSISKSEFIRKVGYKANVTQYAVEDVLEAMEDVLAELFKLVDDYDKVKVRVTRNIQMGAHLSKKTRRRVPGTEEMIDINPRCEPFCKYLSSFLEKIRK